MSLDQAEDNLQNKRLIKIQKKKKPTQTKQVFEVSVFQRAKLAGLLGRYRRAQHHRGQGEGAAPSEPVEQR